MQTANGIIQEAISLYNPPKKYTLAEWVEEFYELTSGAIKGRFSFEYVPYLKGIMDAFSNPDITEIVVKKSAQVGYSTFVRSLIAYNIATASGPTLAVLPRETDCEKLADEGLVEVCRQEAVKPFVVERTHEGIRATTTDIFLGFSGSPQSMQSRAIQTAIGDEVDNFEEVTDVADPVNMMRTRTITYKHHAKLLFGSTPTTGERGISKLFDAAPQKFYFHVPCPHCGAKQRLNFDNLKWQLPEEVKSLSHPEQAEYVKANDCVSYQCEACQQAIKDSQRWGMIQQGQWASEQPKSSVVAFHISALYSYFISWHRLVAEFLQRCDTLGGKRDFRMQWLGEAWEDIDEQIKTADIIAGLENGPEPLIVPNWAATVTVAVDTQEHDFRLIVNAWGREKTAMFWCGSVRTLDELWNNWVNRYYAVDGYAHASAKPALCVIDSGGHRADEVYAFHKKHPDVVIPVKGASWDKAVITAGREPKMAGVELKILNTNILKNTLQTMIKQGLWICHNQTPLEYFESLAAEAKVREKSGKVKWKELRANKNHFLDCSAYSIAAAEMCQTQLLPDENRIKQQWDEIERRLALQATQPSSAPVQHKPRLTINTSYLRK